MKRKLLSTLMLSLALVVSACSSGNPVPPETENTTESESVVVDLSLYKEWAAEYNSLTWDTSVLLYNLGTREYNQWDISLDLGGSIDFDHILESSYEWLKEESGAGQNDIESNYSQICDLYKNIIIAEISGEEAAEIEQSVKDMHSSFDQLYLLVTAPSGDINSFASTFNDCVTNIKSTNNTLSLLTE